MSKSLKLDFCFILRIFFYRNWWFIGQSGEGGDHLLFHVTTSTRSQTLRHLFATLQMRWLHVFLIATLEFTRLLLDEIYHLIELPSDWLLADEMFVCLLNELVLGFCYSDFDMGNQWIWTRIDRHPCIINEPTNQVCWSSALVNYFKYLVQASNKLYPPTTWKGAKILYQYIIEYAALV